MTFLTFREVAVIFNQNDPTKTHRCIANPGNQETCAKPLDSDQVDNAAQIFKEAGHTPDLEQVRCVINCLLCKDCQKTYTHKNKVEKKWREEFPNLGLSEIRRSSSPSPYLSKGGSQSGAGSPRLPRSTSAPVVTAQSYPLANLSVTLPPPDFSSKSKARNTAPPEAMRASQSSLPTFLELPEDANDGIKQHEVPDSPSESRAKRQARNNSQTQISFDDVVESIEPAGDDAERTFASGAYMADVAFGTDAYPGDEEFESQIVTASPEAPNPFQVREASTWAPWTIRSQVLRILLEPHGNFGSSGTIYAIRVKDMPYVKIGFTMKKVGPRWTGIKNQHKLELETDAGYYLSGIPWLQLLRLEALVHADLAFFRRNYRPGRGKKTGAKKTQTHTEYFEIDLSTAQKSIKTWRRVIQDLYPGLGGEMSKMIYNQIRLSAALDMETTEDQSRAIPSEMWTEVNTDHAQRESVWRKVFDLDQEYTQRPRDSDLSKGTTLTFSWPIFKELDVPTLLPFLAVGGLAFMFGRRWI